MESILVTGGMGFIGSNFIDHVINITGDRVINLDLLTPTCNPHNLDHLNFHRRYKFCHGDIGDQELVSTLLSKYQPKAVINFAAETHVDRSIINPYSFVDTNIVRTFRLIDSCCTYWQGLDAAKPFRFLQISTDEVYGSVTDLPFTESSPYQPNNPYAAAKASADHLGRSYGQTYGLPLVTIHASNNYGSRQFPEKLIPLMILNALQGKKLPIYGDGLNVRDWLYVEDHCRAIHLVMQSGKIGETYNIGGDRPVTNLEIVTQICKILDNLAPKPYPHQNLITFVSDRLGHDRRYHLNCHKIQQQLGWQPTTDLETGLQKTVQWYMANTQNYGVESC